MKNGHETKLLSYKCTMQSKASNMKTNGEVTPDPARKNRTEEGHLCFRIRSHCSINLSQWSTHNFENNFCCFAYLINLHVYLLLPRNNAVDMYSGGVLFVSRPGHLLSSVLPGKCGSRTSIMSRPLLSRSFPIHRSCHRSML
jgi:hypothetical protein